MKNEKILRNAIQIETVQTCNPDTGEVVSIEQEVKTLVLEKEPDYVKLYTSDIGRILDLPGNSSDVLSVIASHMAYKSNMIVLYGPIKKVLMEELGMTKNTFNKAIDNLYKAGMLIRVSKACYIIDPELYGKGSWRDVKKVRLSIEYNSDGTKSLKTELYKQYQDEKELVIDECQKRIKPNPKALNPSNNQLLLDFNETEK